MTNSEVKKERRMRKMRINYCNVCWAFGKLAYNFRMEKRKFDKIERGKAFLWEYPTHISRY